MLKLNLGCGGDYLEGWVNIDAFHQGRVDERYDITNLPYEENSVDEIKAFHIIEHFPWSVANQNLRNWYKVLKPGGRLWLETPDFLASCQEFVNRDDAGRLWMRGHFFASGGDVPGQLHYFLYTEYELMHELRSCGFKIINRIQPSSGYLIYHPPHVFLAIEAYK